MESFLISQDEKDDQVVEMLAAREREVDSYEMAIATVSLALKQPSMANLDTTTPARFRDLQNPSVDATEREWLDFQTAARYASRDNLRREIEATKVQLERSRVYYGGLRDSLPPERLAAAADRFRQRK